VSSLHPNVPPTGFWKPLVSKDVLAVRAAALVGPVYVPTHSTAGQSYARVGSKLAIGPKTSLPAVVGLSSVSRDTVSRSRGEDSNNLVAPFELRALTRCYTDRVR
jgi:hypothetical protein